MLLEGGSMNKIFFIDSDGTLRHDDGTITEETKDKIAEIKNQGDLVVICTGRPRYHAVRVASIANASNYVISSNGSEIYDTENNELIYSKYIDKDTFTNLYKDSIEHDIRMLCALENTEYATKYIVDNCQRLLTDENVEELANKDIRQILIIDKNKEKVDNFKKLVKEKYNVKILEYQDIPEDETWFSLIHKDASKGNAIIALSKYLGIPLQNTIAIGNDNNDISMMDQSGLGIAVENATEKLKEAAELIIPSNNEDGVAELLDVFIKKDKVKKIERGNNK